MKHTDRQRSFLLGPAIRALRQQKGLTQAQVSEKTGLAISTLSKLENGQAALSHDKLMLLSQGLAVDMALLLNRDQEMSRALTRCVGRRMVQRAGDGEPIDTVSYRQRYLATELLHKRMAPLLVDVQVRSLGEFIAEFGALIRHAGEEFVLVLEGELDFHSEHYAPLRLNAGDSIYFDSDMGHAYINASQGRCRLVAVRWAPPSRACAAVA